MAADSLPANEHNVNKFRNWIIKEPYDDHIDIPIADRAYAQYDMAVIPHTPSNLTAFCGIVDRAVAINHDYTIHAAEGIQIDTRRIATGSLFTAFGQEVWYNPTTKQYEDTEDSGLWLVGYVIIPTNSGGVMRFEKRRYALAGEES